MIRILFSAVLAIHGLIHLIGFSKEWNLGPNGSFTGKTLFRLSENVSKLAGILWLVTCVLLIAATISYYLKKDFFWILAASGIVLSQALIIIYWQDAKWGTIANIIILIVLIFSAGRFNFNKMVTREVEDITSVPSESQGVITSAMIEKLPPVVQTWLTKSHLSGNHIPNSVHIIQQGQMRTDAKSNWMSFNATQDFTLNPPAFVWSANIHVNAFLQIAGRDKYQNGRGNMLIKAASLFPLANSSGPEIDEGTMIRFMAEMIWFPHAVTSSYLTWEQLTDHRARVTMNYGGVEATGIYTFNNEGLPVGFEADRFYESKGTYSKTKWSVAITGYRYFNGMPIGNKSEVTWKLEDGDFTWLRLEIMDVEYE